MMCAPPPKENPMPGYGPKSFQKEVIKFFKVGFEILAQKPKKIEKIDRNFFPRGSFQKL